jgi:hypothetical protein
VEVPWSIAGDEWLALDDVPEVLIPAAMIKMSVQRGSEIGLKKEGGNL